MRYNGSRLFRLAKMEKFKDRCEAGAMLGEALARMKLDDPVVYALPRGGAPVGAAVAKALDAPFDFILVRKLGAPGFEELAIGAVADGAEPATILHEDQIRDLGVSEEYIREAERTASAEIERRRELFRARLPAQNPAGRTAVIVDDGLATGATMEAAVKAMRKAGARRIVVAVPVAPRDLARRFRERADDLVCLATPAPFFAVGAHYGDFRQLTDNDVLRLLEGVDREGRFRRKAD